MKNMVDFAPPPEPSAVPRQKLTVKLPKFEGYLELEEAMEHVALLKLTCGVKASLMDWSGNVSWSEMIEFWVMTKNIKGQWYYIVISKLCYVRIIEIL